MMKNIFDYASREKGIRVADINGIPIKQTQKQMRVLSRMEQKKLSRYLCANLTPCHLGILVCLYTGLRIGEICALKWQDISFDDHYLYVHKAMQRVQYYENWRQDLTDYDAGKLPHGICCGVLPEDAI